MTIKKYKSWKGWRELDMDNMRKTIENIDWSGWKTRNGWKTTDFIINFAGKFDENIKTRT
jgi:hypothetical protein